MRISDWSSDVCSSDLEVFVKRGLALDGGTSWSVPRLVGPRRAKQMAFFGDTVDAATALDWGLINEVVTPEELPATDREWGMRLATGPSTAISLMKSQMDSSATRTLEEDTEDEAGAQHIVYTTQDMKEGIKADIDRKSTHLNTSN